ncbi:MAG: phosphoenolpyruvate--protein phosphotransferase [Desulfobacterales bacterium]|nr:MAG: phosphoenolpyruvate--protein phosphotransferase [Desulfobacterales bacterium]
MSTETEERHPEIRLRGIGASPGICIGKAYLVSREGVNVVKYYPVSLEKIGEEKTRFNAAVKKSRDELHRIIEETPDEYREHASILETHVLLLKDKMLYGRTMDFIEQQKINAEWALRSVVFDLKETFEKMAAPFFRDRIEDVLHVSQRIMMHLSGGTGIAINAIDKRVILVAPDLSPAETSQIQLERVKGFVTDRGGVASHTGIIARGLEIPAVLGLQNACRIIRNDDFLVVDGSTGTLIVHPTESTLLKYEERGIEWERRRNLIRARASQTTAATADGQPFSVMGNIELPEEVAAVKANGGNGIGLYRTEFQYISRQGFPSEAELLEDYREVAGLMAPFPVTIRTLDINGDKTAAYFNTEEEANPALGFRAIRYCLQRADVFRTQLRAILRAGVAGNIRLMFPLISCMEELRMARAVLEDVKAGLRRENIPFAENLPVGIMMEVPSALLTSDRLADEADFFSIGTNDLIQYTLAIDRGNRYVAHLFDPLHPAIIRLIHRVAKVGRERGIPVYMCGEMASTPLFLPLLLGMGISELSMIPQSIPLVKEGVAKISPSACAGLIRDALACGSGDELRQLLMDEYGDMMVDSRPV